MLNCKIFRRDLIEIFEQIKCFSCLSIPKNNFNSCYPGKTLKCTIFSSHQRMEVQEAVVSTYKLARCIVQPASPEIHAFSSPLPLVSKHDFPQSQKFWRFKFSHLSHEEFQSLLYAHNCRYCSYLLPISKSLICLLFLSIFISVLFIIFVYSNRRYERNK